MFCHDPKEAEHTGQVFCHGTLAHVIEDTGVMVCGLCNQVREPKRHKRSPIRRPMVRTAGLEAVRDLAPEVWQPLRQALLDLRNLFEPEWAEVIKVELCGSWAFNFARPWSDLDVNLACDSWRDLHQLDYLRRASTTLRGAATAIENQFGLTIQVASRTVAVDSPEAPKDLVGKYPVYSLIKEKFFNKKDYEVFPHTLRWDKPTMWWDVLPAKNQTASFTSDPFADEVTLWQTRYGKHFLDMTPYVHPD